MGIMANLIEADLGDIDPREMAEHFRAVASLTKQQLTGMLGWAQQGQDEPVYRIAYALVYEAADYLFAERHWRDLAEQRAAIEGIPFPSERHAGEPVPDPR